MQDQAAALECQQQVFGAPADGQHPLARELRGHLRLDGPAQARLVDAQRRNAMALQGALDAAARGLDLGQLRHAATVTI